jgi:hypothetical protein
MPTEDIIPIAYMGGTGGRFLCHFIVSAKEKKTDILTLSTYGNAHDNGLKDIPPTPFVLLNPDFLKIKFILNAPPTVDAVKPYYTASHMWDLALASNHFKKIIKITYDLDDVVELSKVMFGKWYLTSIFKDNKSRTPAMFEHSLKRYSYRFKEEDIPNVLFISWKELFKGDTSELINKISKFTDIDRDNFLIGSLTEWRNKTQYGIDTFT